ncbi:MAG: hypothetical protein AAF570_20865 [Bacteroidota bacterium]
MALYDGAINYCSRAFGNPNWPAVSGDLRNLYLNMIQTGLENELASGQSFERFLNGFSLLAKYGKLSDAEKLFTAWKTQMTTSGSNSTKSDAALKYVESLLSYFKARKGIISYKEVIQKFIACVSSALGDRRKMKARIYLCICAYEHNSKSVFEGLETIKLHWLALSRSCNRKHFPFPNFAIYKQFAKGLGLLLKFLMHRIENKKLNSSEKNLENWLQENSANGKRKHMLISWLCKKIESEI